MISITTIEFISCVAVLSMATSAERVENCGLGLGECIIQVRYDFKADYEGEPELFGIYLEAKERARFSKAALFSVAISLFLHGLLFYGVAKVKARHGTGEYSEIDKQARTVQVKFIPPHHNSDNKNSIFDSEKPLADSVEPLTEFKEPLAKFKEPLAKLKEPSAHEINNPPAENIEAQINTIAPREPPKIDSPVIISSHGANAKQATNTRNQNTSSLKAPLKFSPNFIYLDASSSSIGYQYKQDVVQRRMGSQLKKDADHAKSSSASNDLRPEISSYKNKDDTEMIEKDGYCYKLETPEQLGHAIVNLPKPCPGITSESEKIKDAITSYKELRLERERSGFTKR